MKTQSTYYGEAVLARVRANAAGDARLKAYVVTYRKEARYRYYVCTKAQQNGVKACPASSVPAAAFEQCSVERIRTLATHPEMIEQVLGEAASMREQRIPELRHDIERLAILQFWQFWGQQFWGHHQYCLHNACFLV